MPVTSSEIGEARPTSAPLASERPVFAAPSARRRRLLRAAGVGAFGLAAAWMIALVLGTFGFDALPGFTLPGEPDRADAPSGAVAGARESATRNRENGDATSATRVARAITRSAGASANPSKRASRTSRARRTRGHRGGSRSTGGAVATTRGTPAASSPGAGASAGTPAAQAPAATPTTAQGTGRGRPASPGDRRSSTAGTGGNSGTTTAAPATTTTTTESPGRSGSAPGRTR